MFEIFNKKRYLVDYLENFVDIHNHVLPGIDDGANSVSDSLRLIREYQSIGIQRIIATPHIYGSLYPNTPHSINKAHQLVLDAMREEGIETFNVDVAAEHMVDLQFEELLSNHNHMPMRGGYMLVEMSFLQPPLNFDEAIIEINKRHLTPILAHPERYGFLLRRPKKITTMRNQGIQMQVNILSLIGNYDKNIQQLAWKLLEGGMADFLGSDIHNMNHFRALKRFKLNQKQISLISHLVEKSNYCF